MSQKELFDSTDDKRADVPNGARQKYRVLSEEEKKAMAAVKDANQAYLDTLAKYCLPGRETSLAITNAEQSCMWAVRGITK